MEFTLDAQVRDVKGKGASRRLRREEGLVPAVVYGGEKEPQSITLVHKDFIRVLEEEAFYSHTITLNIGGEKQEVLLKDLQRHPAKPLIVHADFLRVNKDSVIKQRVPVHFTNEEAAKGVKMGGGKVHHHMTEIEVICKAGDLPEFIEIDMTDVELGQVIHLSDVKFPKGVESLALSHGADHDTAVVSIDAPKKSAEPAEDAESEEGEGDSAE